MTSLHVYEGAAGSKFVADSTNGFGELLALISREADAPIQSCARERAAEPLLRSIGKMSQRELFDCAQAKARTGKCPPSCRGNCNPANPPGHSTHERRNDGIAYRFWPSGFKLPYWARGVDVQRTRIAAFCAEARKHGYTVTATYPGSPSESQHVNFRKRPRISLWMVRPVRANSRGPRARWVIWALRDLGYVEPHYNAHHRIDGHVDLAIRKFQREHHQKADGVVGVDTMRALVAARRAHDKRRKAK